MYNDIYTENISTACITSVGSLTLAPSNTSVLPEWLAVNMFVHLYPVTVVFPLGMHVQGQA